METKKRPSILNQQVIEKIGFSALTLVTLLTVAPIIAIVIYIIYLGAPAISWEFITAMPEDGMRAGGILPAIIGTLYLTLGTAIFSVPLGVAAAIYLSEYAPDNRATRYIRLAIINLAGIPSVVYGLFGLGLFVIFLKFGTSILSASLTLSIMTLPVIITTTEEALRAVPQSFRGGECFAGRDQVANHPAPGSSASIAGDPYGCGAGTGTRRRRNGSNPVHWRSFLLTAAAKFPVGCHHGTALSPVCHFDSGAGNASSDSIWHSAGADDVCTHHESDRDRHSFPGSGPQAVVIMDKVVIENLSLKYSDGTESLFNINLRIQANKITALIGPSGGGKSTFLRVLNRLNDLADVAEVSGRVLIDGVNILDPDLDVIELRRKVGIVFFPSFTPSTFHLSKYLIRVRGRRRKKPFGAG